MGKKLYSICAVLLIAFTLSGCSRKQEEANGRMLIMAYDKLYEGNLSEDNATCMGDSGCVGGIIVSTVWENEVPTSNGQTNFGELGSYYTKGDDEMIEVFISEKDSWYNFYRVK